MTIPTITTFTIDGQACLTAEAAAVRAGCSLPTLYRRVRAGALRPIRYHGRVWFVVADLNRLIRQDDV